MQHSTPRILMRISAFTGAGLDVRTRLDPPMTYTVPANRNAQIMYLRAGNSSDELIGITLMRDGTPMRLFPVGARAAAHVALAVLEDLQPDTELELLVSAPAGANGEVVIDLGLMEI